MILFTVANYPLFWFEPIVCTTTTVILTDCDAKGREKGKEWIREEGAKKGRREERDGRETPRRGGKK